MAAIFYAWLYGRFIEIQSNFRRKKLHRTNQGSSFLGGSFSNRDNVRAPIQFRRESQPQHLKNDSFWRADPSIFISIAPVLLDGSHETTWVFSGLKSNHFLSHSTVSCRSDSSSEANDSCCHRSDGTLKVESSINIESTITGNIIRKVNNV